MRGAERSGSRWASPLRSFRPPAGMAESVPPGAAAGVRPGRAPGWLGQLREPGRTAPCHCQPDNPTAPACPPPPGPATTHPARQPTECFSSRLLRIRIPATAGGWGCNPQPAMEAAPSSKHPVGALRIRVHKCRKATRIQVVKANPGPCHNFMRHLCFRLTPPGVASTFPGPHEPPKALEDPRPSDGSRLQIRPYSRFEGSSRHLEETFDGQGEV